MPTTGRPAGDGGRRRAAGDGGRSEGRQRRPMRRPMRATPRPRLGPGRTKRFTL